MTTTNQQSEHGPSDAALSAFEAWATTRLARIESESAQMLATLTERTSPNTEVMWTSRNVERLGAEASLLRLLVADREVGLMEMHSTLRPDLSGTRDQSERALRRAEATASLLDRVGHCFTDREIRQIACGFTSPAHTG
jgi:hypothetical protein